MMKKFRQIEDRDTLHTKVCAILREAILKGELKPGERLVQEELAEALGVSRMPVREALRKLETEGLISMEPHRGAVVKSLSIEEIEEIYALRSELERMALEQSIPRMNDDDIRQLEELHQKMEQMHNIDEFIEANIEFHRLLIHRCTWKRLLSFIETLWNGFPQQTPHMISGQMDISHKEHRSIITAVKERDVKKAGNLLSAHISRTGEALLQRLRETD